MQIRRRNFMLPQHLPYFTVDAEGAFDAAGTFPAQMHINHTLRKVCVAQMMDFQKAKQQIKVGSDFQIGSVQSVLIEEFFIAVETRMRRYNTQTETIRMKDGWGIVAQDFLRIGFINESDIAEQTINLFMLRECCCYIFNYIIMGEGIIGM